jgi:hypothetical protein
VELSSAIGEPEEEGLIESRNCRKNWSLLKQNASVQENRLSINSTFQGIIDSTFLIQMTEKSLAIQLTSIKLSLFSE